MEYYAGRPVRRAALKARTAIARQARAGRRGLARPRPLAPRSRLVPRLGSKTTVMRRRKYGLNVQNVKPTPGLTSHSAFYKAHRPTRQVMALKRVGAPNYYVINGANQTICEEGFQNASFVTWNPLDQLKTMSNKVPNNQIVNPPVTYKTNRYVLESTQAELLITNSSLASAYVELYDIVRKRDANASDFSFTADPLSAWIQGEFDATGVSANDYKVLHASPFDSQVFKNWFKVVKRTRVELSQGATHRHAVNLKPNRLIDAALTQFVDGDIAGLTMYTMVVFNGQPASIPADSGAVVTTAKIALDFVSSTRYKFSWVQDTTSNATIQDNLSSLTGEQIASPGLGDIILNKIV